MKIEKAIISGRLSKKKHLKFSFHQNHIRIQTNSHLFIETIECSAEKLIERGFAANYFQLECNQVSHKIVFACSGFNEDLTRSKCARKILHFSRLTFDVCLRARHCIMRSAI